MKRESRIGESLWQEWTGEGYESARDEAIVFFTEDHVDVDHEIVQRALASALQRDGSVTSLGQGYKAIESAIITKGYAGQVDGEHDLTLCDEQGETRYGDCVDAVVAVTWVEV